MTQFELFALILFVQGVIAGLALQRWWYWRREAKTWRTLAALFRDFPPLTIELQPGAIVEPIRSAWVDGFEKYTGPIYQDWTEQGSFNQMSKKADALKVERIRHPDNKVVPFRKPPKEPTL